MCVLLLKQSLEEWNVVFRLEGHAHESCRNIGHRDNVFPEFIIDLPSFTSFLDTLLGRPMATKPFRRPIHWILCQRLYMYIKHLTSERGSLKPFHGQGATPSKALFTAMNKSQPWFSDVHGNSFPSDSKMLRRIGFFLVPWNTWNRLAAINQQWSHFCSAKAIM